MRRVLRSSSLSVRHFPCRGVEQFCRKARNGARALAATDLGSDNGWHWRAWGQLDEQELLDEYRTKYQFAEPDSEGLVFDPAPFGRWS